MQGEGRVPQPGIAVVPVAVAPDGLGERGRRRRADGAARLVGEGLQGDERAHDQVAPAAVVGAASDPVVPVVPRVVAGCEAVEGERGVGLRGEPGEREGAADVARHGEGGNGGVVLANETDGAVQAEAVAGGDEDEAVTGRGGPGRDRAVLVTHDQLHLHLDGATTTLDDAVDHRVAVVRRHEVAHRHRACRRLEDRLENQGLRFVMAGDLGYLALRSDQPPSVARVAEQRREGGAGVDSRRAPPVDRIR